LDSSKVASSNPIENAFMRPPAAAAAGRDARRIDPARQEDPTGTSDTS
jgi:hypothetical protein